MTSTFAKQLPAVIPTTLFTNPYAIEVLKYKKEELVEGITNPDDLLNWFIENGILSSEKKMAIAYYRTKKEKNSRLLDILVSKGERACRLFFYPCLKEIEPSLYSKMKQYVSDVNESIGDGKRQLVGYLLERDKDRHQTPTKQIPERTKESESLTKVVNIPTERTNVRVKEKKILPEIPNVIPKESPSVPANIFDAAANGDLTILEAMLKSTNINAVNQNGDTLLHVAAANGQVPVIEFLISKGAKVDANDKNQRTPLHRAAQNGHAEAVRVLLRAGANIYSLDSDSQTSLHLAVKNNHDNVVKILLQEEDRRYKNRPNFLHMAAAKDNSNLVQLLLKNGVNVDTKDDKKHTALFHAVSGSHENTVKVLLENGATIDPSIIDVAFSTNNESIFGLLLQYSKGLSPDTLVSAMFKAVKKNLYGIINALIDKGTDINATNDIQYTPLLLAAELGHSESVYALINKGARLDVRTANLNTALHLAVQAGDVSVTKLLIQKGININITGPGDQTPLHVAAFHNKHKLIDILIEAGANVNAVTKELVTPLHIASQRGNLDVAQRLIQYKAKVNSKDKQAKTPLHLAANGGEEAMVDLLLNNKADPNAADKEKKTPLHIATVAGQSEVVENLLKYQARYGAKDMDGCTPMHYAAIQGNADIVRALLKAGKNNNLDDKNIWRKTPLHLAADHGHSDLVNMFLQSGAAINSLDNNKDTPLHCACKAGHLKPVQTLVGWAQGEKANLQATNALKKTPLQVAESGNTDSHQHIVTLLKKKMLIIR
ncbi:CARD- and ANK-domain containing inflammasome adapter protein-like [Bombina bombina]|uniref:CARD- and ANK-domain containing inflammasome adapter protein-like n=1 Tax=Bombina bombina TaxID=8345 RepID=UPI00235AFA30|nr:CARD- and ANK-domain containing inflammasome adapter protein-like [Bombina bombina]